MREILFRGKNGNDDWVYGDFRNTNGMFPHNAFIVQHSNDMYHPVKPKTVGQYTGMEDKNGNKIFEGDIVDASNEWWDAAGFAGHDSPILQVEWDKYTCGFALFSVYDSDCGVFIDANGCEVIGNIYDNPELLK